MNEYSALLCIAVHPKHFTIGGGVSPKPPPVCSIHLDDVTAATAQRFNTVLLNKTVKIHTKCLNKTVKIHSVL